MNSHDFFKQFSDREAYDSDFFEYAVFAYTSNQDSVRLMFPSIKDSAVIGLADTALKKEDNPELRDKRINLYTTLTAFSDTLVADKHHFIVIQKKHVGRLK